MVKKIEVSPITNEDEFSAAFKIRGKLVKVLIRQSANCLILSLLVFMFFLTNYTDYIEYYVYEYVVIGCLVASLIAALSAFLFVYFFTIKYRPFFDEIERYVNENPGVLERLESPQSEKDLSFLSSLEKEEGANLQNMDTRIRGRE
ncbi:hypothetical protein ABEH28_13215 [Pseudomonas sp. Ps21-P2]|uniref:hypothetical protein n=1 Tax=Pseudomonas sp. Ps21-P2 TaxID=3080331 RepID=UPI0032098EAB